MDFLNEYSDYIEAAFITMACSFFAIYCILLYRHRGKHADYGTYALLDLWANVARGCPVGITANTIARYASPLEERYNPKEKIPENTF